MSNHEGTVRLEIAGIVGNNWILRVIVNSEEFQIITDFDLSALDHQYLRPELVGDSMSLGQFPESRDFIL